MARRPILDALAERVGIVAAYRAAGSGARQVASDETRAAVLAALGHDASSEQSAHRTLTELETRAAGTWLAPVRVVTEGAADAARISLRPPASSRVGDWRLELHLEDGESRALEGCWRPRARARGRSIELPGRLGPGYHRIEVRVECEVGTLHGEQLLIVAPERCFEPWERLGASPRRFGVWANLYSVRGRADWGFGDFGDLRRLTELVGEAGGDFVGINPLHALWNRAPDVSPYAPVTRLYRNPLYLELAAVPELTQCPELRQQMASPAHGARLDRLRQARRLDYGALAAYARDFLGPLHRVFAARHRGAGTERGRAYAQFLEREGRSLLDFATFVALAEHLGALQGFSEPERDWRRWPIRYRDPTSSAVEEFRRERADAVDFHGWIQFELDRQLGRVAADARRAGLELGLYTDLALGSTGSGSDAWSFGAVLAQRARAGAPPDDFAPDGQDWGFPPLHPQRLRDERYVYWIRVLRSAFAHAGALRIDHILGLRRLYWIPDGRSAREGAYVRYPESDLLGILALESRRHASVVIGEDLGTVPPGFAASLARRGILSSRVLYFEQQGGRFRPARRYSPRALVTASTHDLAPLAGHFAGRDLALRRTAGALDSDEALAIAVAERRRQRSALVRRLVADGVLASDDPPPDAPALTAAVTDFLCRTPAPLVGISLDDLAGETEPVNLPGVAPELHPSWTRRMGATLEEIATDPVARASLEIARSERPRRPSADVQQGEH